MEKKKVLVPRYLCSHPCVYTLTHTHRGKDSQKERERVGGGMFEKLKHHCTKSILSPPVDWVQMHQYFFSSLWVIRQYGAIMLNVMTLSIKKLNVK